MLVNITVVAESCYLSDLAAETKKSDCINPLQQQTYLQLQEQEAPMQHPCGEAERWKIYQKSIPHKPRQRICKIKKTGKGHYRKLS